MSNALHQFTADPLDMVWLHNGFVCEVVGERTTVKYERVLDLIDALFRAVALKPALLIGKEIAYLRRSLDLSQRDLGDMLAVSEQTVSLWERGAHAIVQSAETVLRRHCVESLPKTFVGLRKETTVAALSRLAKNRASFVYEGRLSGNGWGFVLCLTRDFSAEQRSAEATDATFEQIHLEKVFAYESRGEVVSQVETKAQNEGAQLLLPALPATLHFATAHWTT